MSFFGKLMFWKREEREDLGRLPGELGLGIGELPGAELDEFGLPKQKFEDFGRPKESLLRGMGAEDVERQRLTPTTLQPQPSFHPDILAKDIEIVSYKLDAIKATLESINQRLANLERAHQEKIRKEW